MGEWRRPSAPLTNESTTMTLDPLYDDCTSELCPDMAEKAAALTAEALRAELAYAFECGPYNDEEEPEGLWFAALQAERVKRGLPEGFGKV